MRLGCQIITGRGREFAEKPVGGEAGQRLVGYRREVEDGGRMGARPPGVACGEVPASPGELPVCLAEDALAPGQPAVVCLQPGASARQIATVETEIGRQTLEEEAFLVNDVARFGRRSVGQDGMDFR